VNLLEHLAMFGSMMCVVAVGLAGGVAAVEATDNALAGFIYSFFYVAATCVCYLAGWHGWLA
jgi:hypothetical protein